MALKTLGSTAQTSLQAILWPAQGSPPAGNNTPTDLANLSNLIRADNANYASLLNAYLDPNGLLKIPGRGTLTIKSGDYVGVDNTGWPVLISSYAIANGPWIHT